jgi:hypothetical protein
MYGSTLVAATTALFTNAARLGFKLVRVMLPLCMSLGYSLDRDKAASTNRNHFRVPASESRDLACFGGLCYLEPRMLADDILYRIKEDVILI